MYLLLAIICPPAAVLILGRPSQSALNLQLTLLLYFPGVWHALSVVDQHKIDRRNETLTRLVMRYYA
jgi:uncharacterized membrane protein YqaE (UPF0057 family)